MDKNTIIGLLLIVAVMFGYGYYNSSQRPQETLVNTTQSVAKENTQTATAAQKQKEEPTIDRISAIIYVARDSQKGIIIGHRGEMLKKVGTASRLELEKFLGKKVFLQLHVKVDEGWRNSQRSLRRYGYLE